LEFAYSINTRTGKEAPAMLLCGNRTSQIWLFADGIAGEFH
jgi:hypothetical protein